MESDHGNALNLSCAPDGLLQVRGLTVQYRRHKAPLADRVSFDLRGGEACGLTGDSGCGKTTLAYALIRLLPAGAEISGGSIRFQGQDLLRLSGSQLRRMRGSCISLMSQDPEQALNPVLRVGLQIGDVIYSHGQYNRMACQKRVEELLQSVGLSEAGISSAYPHELSGGQRQRVVLAQALAAQPKLLIADEPTSALDPETRAGIMTLLLDLKRRLGLTILLISHDTVLLNRFVDRTLEMNSGRLFERTGNDVGF